MDSIKFGSWIQITATFGVVLGLALVIIELQQTKALTRAQLGSQHFAEVLANQRTLMGENPSESLHKACLYPEKLAVEDLMVLRSYVYLVGNQALRGWGLERIGRFDSAWESGAFDAYAIIASTKPGRAWLANHNIRFKELRAIRDAVLENYNGTECASELGILEDAVAALH